MTTLQAETIIRRLRHRLPRHRLDPETPLRSLGLDSMDTVELLCAIHEEFGVRLTEAEFPPDLRLCDLAEVIAHKIPSP
jgi:acyl carrier protein